MNIRTKSLTVALEVLREDHEQKLDALADTIRTEIVLPACKEAQAGVPLRKRRLLLLLAPRATRKSSESHRNRSRCP